MLLTRLASSNAAMMHPCRSSVTDSRWWPCLWQPLAMAPPVAECPCGCQLSETDLRVLGRCYRRGLDSGAVNAGFWGPECCHRQSMRLEAPQSVEQCCRNAPL